MEEETSSRPDMVGEVRFKVPLVLAIPFAAMALIALVVIGFSRVLLELPAEAATAVALVTAANILIACTFLAVRRVERVSVLEVILIALYPILIGVVLAQTGFFSEEGHSATAQAEEPTGGQTGTSGSSATSITAQGLAFDTDTIEVTTGESTDYTLVNEDTTVHNLAIYEGDEASGEALFTSPDVDAGAEESFAIDPLKPGDYYFQCDYHPQMAGTVTSQ